MSTDWLTGKISDLIDGLVAGVSVRSGGGHANRAAVLKTSAIHHGRFIPSEAKPIVATDVSRARCNPVADSLILSRMNTPALVGDVGYVAETHPDLFLPDRLWLARPKRGSDTDMRWLTYLFASEPGARRLRGLATGTSGSMKNIPKDRILNLEVSVPEPAEQRSISQVLLSADELIAALEQLIAKKQAIKEGMAQELLSGRTRLPGFDQEWIDTTAGDVGAFKGGSGFPLRFQGHTTGRFPFFKVSDMNHPGNERFMRTSNNYISESVRRQLGATAFPRHAIVFAKVGAAVFLERKRILEVPSCIDNNMAAMLVDPAKADYRFIHYALEAFRMSSLVATTALPSLNGTQLLSIPLRMPVDLKEQAGIASVLADADAEIDLLKLRLDKAKAIKQGMAQQLLTGRTRLPLLEAVA